MAMGILLARSDEDEPIELARVPTRRLATVLCRRLRGAVRSHVPDRAAQAPLVAPARMTTAGARDPGPIPLPVGSRVLHVGPSKTGTTSVQAAMWAARESMRRQGVRYAGRMRHSEEAARAAAGLGSPLSNSGAAAPKRRWDEIVAEIRRAPEARVVFSSELLAHAHRDAIRRIADDLDPGRVQVVVTLRPLARILASQWQQNVQTGQTASYEAWLHELFDPRAEGERQAGWWHRHRHDRLVARWAGVVGPERTTVVVVDDRDHGQVLRAFEGLLILRAGTLELQHDLANRSLTLAEAEAMRAFNEAWNANRLGRADHTHLVIQGFALHMKARRARHQRGEDRDAAVGARWRRRGVRCSRAQPVDVGRAHHRRSRAAHRRARRPPGRRRGSRSGHPA